MDGAIQSMSTGLDTCPCCGLLQKVPPVSSRMRLRCARCRTPLHRRSLSARANSRAAAIATAALVLYPFAITLPMIRIEQYGHRSETGVLDGVASLFAHGDWVVGVVVLLCSIVFPLGKLLAILVLAGGGLVLAGHHRALTYRIVEWTGRWGMLDVLVVALLVAVLKLGDLVEVSPGPGALAFATVVVLSLIATTLFDPKSLWDPES